MQRVNLITGDEIKFFSAMCSRVPALSSPLKLNHIRLLVQPWTLPLTRTPPASSNLSMLLDYHTTDQKKGLAYLQRPEELFEPFLKTNGPMKFKKI